MTGSNPVQTLLAQLDGGKPLGMPDTFDFARDVVDRIAREDDRVAVVEVQRDGETIVEHRFSDVAERSVRTARALHELGLIKGDRALVILPRTPVWYDVILGCIRLGVVSMPGTTLLSARDIAYRLEITGARCAIVGPEHAERIDEIRESCPALEHLLVVGGERDGWTSLEERVANADETLDIDALPRPRSDELMMAYFTSGTTSKPKLVPRDHGYALAHAITGAFWLDLKPDDVHWTLTDTGWAKAAWGMLFGPWTMRAAIVLHDAAAFDAEATLRLIERAGVTTFCAPPTVFRLFAQMPLADFDLSSIRHTVGAGEPLNPEIIRVWKSATGTLIHDGYGQTETINIVANIPGTEVRPGSMGKPVPGFDVQVVDDEGHAVDVDAIGHVALRLSDPPPPGLFDGYWIPDGTPRGGRDRQSFHHGFYYTGDTATRDADGYLWFVGRSDDVISSAGYRISPFEVESVLLEHPAIAESAVVGVPDELRGQLVKAFVVLADGQSGSEALTEDIQNFVKRNTAPYKYPRVVEYRDGLPKTISGKIRRVELRAEPAA